MLPSGRKTKLAPVEAVVGAGCFAGETRLKEPERYMNHQKPRCHHAQPLRAHTQYTPVCARHRDARCTVVL